MKKKSLLIGLSLVVLVSVLGVLSYFVFFHKEASKNNNKKDEATTIEIAGYGITLTNSDTEVYKNEFNALKTNLESENIDYNEYAKSIAKLYIIDLYTIENKKNKYDVGGLEFVYESAKENYVTNVTDTLYKYVEDNTNQKRNQQLPVVESINVENIEETNYTIKANNTSFKAYKIKLSWGYLTDLGYDKSAEVIVINDNNKLYVVEENIK